MPKVTEEYRDARRHDIIDAALRRFAVTGFHRTSMADIIDEAGMSAGAIYGHFESKEALLASVAERVLRSRGDELDDYRTAHGPLSPGEVLAVLLRGLRQESFDPGILLQVWGEAATNAGVRAVLQDVLVQVRGTLRPHVVGWAEAHPERAGDGPDAFADRILPVLMGLVPGFLLQRVVVDDFDEDAYIAEVATFLPR